MLYAEEAIALLREGKKVRCKGWAKEKYICLHDNNILYWQNGKRYNSCMLVGFSNPPEWEEYTEPTLLWRRPFYVPHNSHWLYSAVWHESKEDFMEWAGDFKPSAYGPWESRPKPEVEYE